MLSGRGMHQLSSSCGGNKRESAATITFQRIATRANGQSTENSGAPGPDEILRERPSRKIYCDSL